MVQAEILSHGIIRGGNSRRHPLDDCETEPIPNPAYSGWSIQFRYACSCGETHTSNLQNIWPTSNPVHVVEMTCPVNKVQGQEVKLLRPGCEENDESRLYLLDRELRRLRQQERDAEPVKP